MPELNAQKLTNIAMILIVFLGIGITVYGAYLYVDAQQGIDNNKFIQAKESGDPLIPTDVSRLGSEMYQSQIEYNELLNQRGESPRYAGVGLAIIAVAWIGRDFITNQRKKNAAADPESTDDSSQPQSTTT